VRILLILFLIVGTGAQSLTEGEASQVERNVELLGNDRYQTRQVASQYLLRLGRNLIKNKRFGKLSAATDLVLEAAESSDLELSFRASQLLGAWYQLLPIGSAAAEYELSLVESFEELGTSKIPSTASRASYALKKLALHLESWAIYHLHRAGAVFRKPLKLGTRSSYLKTVILDKYFSGNKNVLFRLRHFRSLKEIVVINDVKRNKTLESISWLNDPPKIKHYGEVTLGIKGNSSFSSVYNGKETVFAINRVSYGSSASKAYLKKGNRIRSVGGERVTSLEQVQFLLRSKKAGEEIKVEYYLNYTAKKHRVKTLKLQSWRYKDYALIVPNLRLFDPRKLKQRAPQR